MSSVRRLLICFGFFFVAAVGKTFAAESVAVPQTPVNIEWSAGGPYRTIGNLRKGPHRKATDVPLPVLREAERTLGKRRSAWDVYDFPMGPRKKRTVLARNERGYFGCLVQDGKWCWLNTPAGIPYIADIVTSSFQSPHDLKNVSILRDYLGEVDILYNGPQRAVMSNAFKEKVISWGVDEWLTPNGPSRQVFLRLFHDPLVSRHDHLMSVQSNVIALNGSVRKITVYVQDKKPWTLRKIEVKEIYEEGAFGYPLVS